MINLSRFRLSSPATASYATAFSLLLFNVLFWRDSFSLSSFHSPYRKQSRGSMSASRRSRANNGANKEALEALAAAKKQADSLKKGKGECSASDCFLWRRTKADVI